MHSRSHPGPDGRFSAYDARQRALDLMVLGSRPPDPARRPHRGMLPDLPETTGGAVLHRPTLLKRLRSGLRRVLRVAAGKEAAAILLSVAAGAHVGKSAPASYIAPEDNETRHVPLV